jgi:hypothetical protein
MMALSIRQPWAWLIVQGHKPVENRTWSTRCRGPILIHASKGMTNDEYEFVGDVLETIPELRALGIILPDRKLIERGGIVGIANITDCVTDCESPFFSGPFGFVLDRVAPLPFVPVKGMLGFFDVPNALVPDALEMDR